MMSPVLSKTTDESQSFTISRGQPRLRDVPSGFPVAQPSYKWAWFFPLAQIALWRVKRVRKIKCMPRTGQRTSAEYILRSSKRLEAISNLSSVEA